MTRNKKILGVYIVWFLSRWYHSNCVWNKKVVYSCGGSRNVGVFFCTFHEFWEMFFFSWCEKEHILSFEGFTSLSHVLMDRPVYYHVLIVARLIRRSHFLNRRVLCLRAGPELGQAVPFLQAFHKITGKKNDGCGGRGVQGLELLQKNFLSSGSAPSEGDIGNALQKNTGCGDCRALFWALSSYSSE